MFTYPLASQYDFRQQPDVEVRRRSGVKAMHGFTLVELLVVISIVAMLMALLLPALSRARDAAKTLTCKSRLAGIAIAIEVYRAEYREWYPTSGCTYPDGQASWFMPLVIPYLNLSSESTQWTKLPKENFMLCPSSEYGPPMGAMSNSQRRARIRQQAYMLNFDQVGNYKISAHFGKSAGSLTLADMEARYQPRKFVSTPPSATIMVGEVFDQGELGSPYNGVADVTYYHRNNTHILFVDSHVGSYASPLSQSLNLGEIVFY